jgi:hypothetical protein
MAGDNSHESDDLQLVSDFLDGRLDDAGLARLRELLSSDRQAIETLVDAAIVHDLLDGLYADERSERAAVALLTSLGVSTEADELATPSSVRQTVSAKAWSKSRWLRHSAAAIAATLLVAGAIFFALNRPAAPIATVTRLLEADSDALAVGARLIPGQRLRPTRGLVEITFDSGAVMAVKAPADVELVSELSVCSKAGRLTVDVGERAHGFTIETPTARIVDWGTEFGVGVGDDGTDVVVFDGIVDLHSKRTDLANADSQPKRMQQGDALRVGSDGGLHRIVSMNSQEFPIPNNLDQFGSGTAPVIASVTDNIRGNQTTKCYRIVHGGFREDATAYVDRSHQWNGLDAAGLPKFLLGADYIMTFNDDKRARDLEVTVTFAQDAYVFVLFDRRRTPPDWLTKNFEDIGIEIGLDEGPSFVQKNFTTSVGTGNSVDNRFGVWKSTAVGGQKLVLGPQYGNVSRGDAHAMYGIVAVAR